MTIKHLWLCGAFALLSLTTLHAQETDPVDVLHYDLDLRIRSTSSPYLRGCATIDIRQVIAAPELQLDLMQGTVDSVFLNGERVSDIVYSTPTLTVNTTGVAAGDTFRVTVYYSTDGYSEASGMGGFHVTPTICYTIGVALNEYPHNMGKSWFPCRDNFTDRATYTLRVNSQAGWTAQCGGTCDSVWTDPDGSQGSRWQLRQPIPTYLISVVTAPWQIIERTFEGLYGSYTATIGYRGHDSIRVQRSFDNLDRVIPHYEKLLGPYRWDRIGYVATPVGSMEHVNNICLHTSVMGNDEELAQSNIVHELAHSWFGNLVTCASAADMWFNEGGATFCEELAMEAIHYDDSLYARQYYLGILEKVLRSGHIEDNGYRPLYDQPHAYTYGTTSYKKGALMWHTLRGHIGDSLFYSCLRTLFDRHSFQSIDSWQVRDSLAQYSGINLTNFFDFHVFSSGFVDLLVDSLYRLDSDETVVRLRQRLLGGTQWLKSDRIPVRIVGIDGTYVDVTMSIAGETAEQAFSLPFQPSYAIVDIDDNMARAVTSGNLTINHRGVYRHPLAHFNSAVTACGDSMSWLRVEHHWLAPEGEMPRGIVRTAQRYWNVVGRITDGTRLSGLFFYCCDSDGSVNYPYLDRGFYSSEASHDSLRLLYRPDNRSAWQVVDASLSNQAREGQLTVSQLQTGEYTLAIVDRELLAIDAVNSKPTATLELFPNPCHRTVQVQLADDQPQRLFVEDIRGRRVIDGQPFRQQTQLHLAKGIYFLYTVGSDGVKRDVKKLVVR